MIIVDTALQTREKAGNHVRVALLGAGAMGSGIINQIARYTPGMNIVAVYNRTPEKVLHAFANSGVEDYVLAGGIAGEAQDAVDSGKPVITDDIDLLLGLNGIDVVVEATGTIEFALKAILKAFEKGIHVLSFNAELDSTFGPLLKKLAEDKGVRYSLGDGDQPGVTMNLYRYVRGLGFEPLLCGNIKGLQDHYRNPDTQKGFAAQWGMTPEMVTSFADGTKISFEQSCIANATGMKVAKRGMLGYHSDGHVDDMKELYDIEQLKELGGIVDYVVGAKPSPGVFIYAATNDPNSIKFLKYGKLGDGPLYSFYVPYHLLFFDIASSICRLVDFNDPVIVPKKGPVVDVIAAAKVDLKRGDIIDGLGGFKTYGLCENHNVVISEKLLPMALAMGCRVKRDMDRDEVLTYDDIEIDENSFLSRCKQKQDKLFSEKNELSASDKQSINT
jgi:predicted homoserine dehydrogenase-like protein